MGIHFHMSARSHSRRFQTSQVGQILCLFLYVNVRAVLTYAIIFSPTLPRHLCQNTSQQLWVFQQTRIRLSVFSVKLMHHKQLSFLPALSFIHKAFPSAIPPFAPCLFQTSIACAFSHTQLKVWNGQLHLKPFSCCFKPIYLAVGVYERKMGLTRGLDQTV